MWDILEGSSFVTHSSSSSEDFHDKNKLYELRSRHGRFLEVVSKHFDNFCRRYGIKTHLTTDLSLSFQGNRGTKASYRGTKASYRVNILIEVWISKTKTYCVLKVVKALSITKIKLIQLDGKLMNYVFNFYLESGKGYELCKVELE